jgi:hypothetical protein
MHIYYFIRLHVLFYQVTSNTSYFPSWEVNNLNWSVVVSPSNSGLCGYEECSFGLWCRFGTHVVLLLLDLLSNSLGRPPLASCGEILCDRAQVSTHTPLLRFLRPNLTFYV